MGGRGTRRSVTLIGVEDPCNRVGSDPSPADFEAHSDDRSHHLVTERVRSDGELDDVTCPTPMGPQDDALGRFALLLPTERSKVVRSHQGPDRLVH